MEDRYQKFTTSKQEPLRLAIALEGFFQEGTDSAAREAYVQYLHRRLLPAGAALAAQGWFPAKQTEELIRMAREKRRTAALVWVLRWKGEQYGFHDRDFSL